MNRTEREKEQLVLTVSIRLVELLNILFLMSLGFMLMYSKYPVMQLSDSFNYRQVAVIPFSHTALILAVAQVVLLFTEHHICRKLASIVLTISSLIWGFLAMLHYVDKSVMTSAGIYGHALLAYVIMTTATFFGGMAIQENLS